MRIDVDATPATSPPRPRLTQKGYILVTKTIARSSQVLPDGYSGRM